MGLKFLDRKRWITALLALGVFIVFPGFPVACEWGNRVQNKAECRHFLNRIRLGETQAEVQAKFEAGTYRNLRLVPASTGRMKNQDMVASQPQFGAKNWHIFIFYENSGVVAVKVRTADNIRDYPPDAPPDSGTRDQPEFEPWKD